MSRTCRRTQADSRMTRSGPRLPSSSRTGLRARCARLARRWRRRTEGATREPPSRSRTRLGAAALAQLLGRADNAAVTAEHATVPGLGLDASGARRAVPEEKARVGRHARVGADSALGAGQCAFQYRGAHGALGFAG